MPGTCSARATASGLPSKQPSDVFKSFHARSSLSSPIECQRPYQTPHPKTDASKFRKCFRCIGVSNRDVYAVCNRGFRGLLLIPVIPLYGRAASLFSADGQRRRFRTGRNTSARTRPEGHACFSHSFLRSGAGCWYRLPLPGSRR